jgi:UPF0176 protein
LGFYKYISLCNVSNLAITISDFCKSYDIKGSILLAEEGINASISGTPKSIQSFKKFITSLAPFKDLFFKDEETFEHPFKKMKVKVKNEIVAFKHKVNLEKTGEHITPQQLSELYDESGKLKGNAVILDARNDYEYRIGRFKEAIHLNIKVFRDFKNQIDKISQYADKKVVMYCTGGVRCEKASAFLIEKGFKDVSQLNQGIIQFGKEITNNIWEGKCFVFDKRMASPVNNDGAIISQCFVCGKKCDFLRNCKNVACNRFYISCLECEEKFHKCCSKKCKETFSFPSHLISAI